MAVATSSGLAGSAAVDVDAIPTDLLEAVDVLTGGASAIYGADGVSGVVNFRLKKDFEGLTVRGQTSQSGRGDGDNQFVALTGGHQFQRRPRQRGDRLRVQQGRARERPGPRLTCARRRAAELAQNQDDLDDSTRPARQRSVQRHPLRRQLSRGRRRRGRRRALGLRRHRQRLRPRLRARELRRLHAGRIQHAGQRLPGRSVPGDASATSSTCSATST